MRRIAIRAGFILGCFANWHALTILLIALTAVSVAQYKSRSSPRKVVQLTEPKLTGPVSFEQLLVQQKPVLQFADKPLDFSQIGQLGWAGQGIIDKQSGLRTAPSAGGVYPMELCFAARDGVFLYNPENHTLEQAFDQDVRGRLSAATSEPEAVTEAGCVVIVAGSVRKSSAKFGKQARKYLLLEAGHIAQNIRLQAASLELGSVVVENFDMREFSSQCRLSKGLEPVHVICVGYPALEPPDDLAAHRTRQRRAVLIVAGANFRDEELYETRLALEDAGVKTVVASSKIGPVAGMLGGTADAQILVTDLRVNEFDAIVFIGGLGAGEYVDSPVALDIVREAADTGKVLAAIGIAPVVFANAGVLNGVRATSFPSERIRLQLAGAEFTGAPVERDGPIITASVPQAAALFGQAIADALSGM